jgi:hypothetical protein
MGKRGNKYNAKVVCRNINKGVSRGYSVISGCCISSTLPAVRKTNNINTHLLDTNMKEKDQVF